MEGSSPFLLATFSNYGFASNGRSLWGSRLCEAEDIDTVGFVAKTNNWFPRCSMRRIIQAGMVNVKKPLITYGHSQGGYGALKYASALDAKAVIACAPQYSINPSSTPKDRRFSHHFNPLLHDGMDIGAEDLAGSILLIYDPLDAEDTYQADKILSKCHTADVRRLPVFNVGHSIMDVMRSRELFFLVHEAVLDGRDTSTAFHLAKSLKKGSFSYGYRVAERLLSQRKPALAVGVLEAVLRNAGNVIDPASRARQAFLRSNAFRAMNMLSNAVSEAEIATRTEPSNVRFAEWYRAILA